MDGMFQMGTLFSITKPFRAKGIAFFYLTLLFYCRSVLALADYIGIPTPPTYMRFRFPIIYGFSWFFTSHTFMTLATPFLHYGMRKLSQFYYLCLIIVIIVCVIWFGPKSFFVGDFGFNWRHASYLYFFAGYFVLHGIPIGRSLTWLLFFVCSLIGCFIHSHDILSIIPTKLHWAFLSFRLAPTPDKTTYNFLSQDFVAYVCPLNYVWGIVALYSFRFINLPLGLSQCIVFLGNKVFMIHLLDGLSFYYPACFHNLMDPDERIGTPWLTTKNSLLTTVQFCMFGALLEIFRERLFNRLFDISTKVYDTLRRHNFFPRRIITRVGGSTDQQRKKQ
jgi:hypothetical protein